MQIADREHIKLVDANLLAGQRIQSWLEASIEAYQTIGVETVLSSSKYRPLVLHAKSRGFRVKMIYVLLRSTELQLERIRFRVAEGGHDVPDAKVVARRERSFNELSWFVQNVDECFIYDNSTGEPELVGGLKSDLLVEIRPFPADLRLALVKGGAKISTLSNSRSWQLL